MTHARDLYIYAGSTNEGERVYLQVAIHPGDAGRTVTYTDHTEGPSPERVSITGTTLKKGAPGNPRTAPDGYWLSSGQISDDLAKVTKPGDLNRLEIDAVLRIWASSHLNDMNAACDHMTPEMLAKRDGESVHGEGGWQYRMLDTVVCPVTGYRWGHAWLARKAAAADLETLRSIQRKAV